MLGKLYLAGKEVPRDEEKAAYWLTQSAEQGNQYAIRSASHSSPGRSRRRRRTASAMKRQCAGQRANTPFSLPLTRTRHTSIITFITTRPRWTVPGSFGTLSALAVRCGGSLTAFALKMICPSLPTPSCTARDAFSIMGHGWGRSGNPRTRSSYGLPSMKLLPNAPPILMLSSGSWRRPASRSSMGAAAQFLFLSRGRSGRPGCGHPPSGTVTIQRTSRPSSPGSDHSQSRLVPRLPPLAVSI